MQCWRRHISASSSWDGWGSLEQDPASSGPSTPALWRASWPAVSPPGLETAPLATAGLCKGSCVLPATLLEVSFPPSRTNYRLIYFTIFFIALHIKLVTCLEQSVLFTFSAAFQAVPSSLDIFFRCAHIKLACWLRISAVFRECNYRWINIWCECVSQVAVGAVL